MVSEAYSIKNTKFADKPNEDAFLYDDINGICTVLDGVSRDKKDGKIVKSKTKWENINKIIECNESERAEIVEEILKHIEKRKIVK